MTTNTRFFRILSVFTATVVGLLAPLQPTLAAVAIGQTASADSMVDGVRVPSGTTLLSPALVETGAKPAVVHLSNGEVLTMAPQTQVVIVSGEDGVEVAVRSGNVAYTDASGAVEVVSETESLVMSQEGQIQERRGRPDREEEQEERLCELQDWTPQHWETCRYPGRDDDDEDGCEWQLIEVPMSEVPRYLEINSVLACEDRNDLDLECDCREGAIILWWLPPATAGALIAGVVLSQTLDDDNEPPASPSRP